jgi:hypothetical protein
VWDIISFGERLILTVVSPHRQRRDQVQAHDATVAKGPGIRETTFFNCLKE